MFSKSLSALALLLLLLAPGIARADDGNLLVHYDCDTVKNRMIVKTFISDKKPWEVGKNNLPFTTMVHWSMPLECSFLTGDEVLVKAYYGNGEADTGAYQHVMIIVNGHVIEKLLDFNPGHTDIYRITAPSSILNEHPQRMVDPRDDELIDELPPGYIDFNGMSETDKHKLLMDIRHRQPR